MGIISFLVCLFWELEMGIVVGAVVQVGIVLYNTARPSLKIVSMQASGPGTDYLYVSVDRAIVYPSINFVRNVINKAGVRQGQGSLPVVIDCFHIYTADFTAYKGFAAMASDFKRRGQAVFFVNVRPNVEATLTDAGAGDIVIVHSEEEMRAVLIGENKSKRRHLLMLSLFRETVRFLLFGKLPSPKRVDYVDNLVEHESLKIIQ